MYRCLVGFFIVIVMNETTQTQADVIDCVFIHSSTHIIDMARNVHNTIRCQISTGLQQFANTTAQVNIIIFSERVSILACICCFFVSVRFQFCIWSG